MIRNPVVRGFNPDPSIVRVGEDYFLAVSTFEWFPGVRLLRSTDLATWSVVGHALEDPTVLDLRGVPDSGGVWAPSLTHAGGLFWLAYSVVRTMDGDDKDIDNYLVTAPAVEGPWSAPIHLGSRGFDFSFFHDDDGRHYIVGVQWDDHPDRSSFGGLVLEEYLADDGAVSGRPQLLMRSDTLIEGPNLYRRDGWYYLLIAEGGTGWNHGILCARSRELLGPYLPDPRGSLLTARDDPGAPLQKAGHGELVATAGGEWYLAHLATRPAMIMGERHGVLGRETCIQRIVWQDGWPRLDGGGTRAALEVVGPDTPPGEADVLPGRDDFDAPVLNPKIYLTSRVPLTPRDADLAARPGWLRLRGGRSAASWFGQSMLARRLEERRASVESVVDAAPTTDRQRAGVGIHYDRAGWFWLLRTADAGGPRVRLLLRDRGVTRVLFDEPVTDEPLVMRVDLDDDQLVGWFRERDGEWMRASSAPAWVVSDDRGPELRFTGAVGAIRADDLDGTGFHADFDYFDVGDVP